MLEWTKSSLSFFWTFTAAESLVNTWVKAIPSMWDKSYILDVTLLLRLRQVCS